MDRKPFLLRLDPATMAALRAWADDDLRSLNGQIEFLLRRALRETGRLAGARGARGALRAPSDSAQHADGHSETPERPTVAPEET